MACLLYLVRLRKEATWQYLLQNDDEFMITTTRIPSPLDFRAWLFGDDCLTATSNPEGDQDSRLEPSRAWNLHLEQVSTILNIHIIRFSCDSHRSSTFNAHLAAATDNQNEKPLTEYSSLWPRLGWQISYIYIRKRTDREEFYFNIPPTMLSPHRRLVVGRWVVGLHQCPTEPNLTCHSSRRRRPTTSSH